MKTLLRLFTVTGLLLCGAGGSSANSIVNGSFELPNCDIAGACSNGSWGLFDTILGWTSPVGVIEIGEGTLYGITGFDGDQVLELDSNGNSTVAQVVAGPGAFVLSFLYADRNNPDTESFEVYWNGVSLGPIVPPSNPPNGAMSLYTTTVTAVGGNNTLEFKSTSPSNSLGALIDNVQLNAVPDGGLTSVLLGMSIVGLGVIRRIVG